MHATVIKNSNGCLEVVLYEHGRYARPLAIIGLSTWAKLNADVETEVKVHKYNERKQA